MAVQIELSKNPEIIHRIMIKAFWEYHEAEPPSSALAETVELVAEDLRSNGQALLMRENNKPIAMVRFFISDKTMTVYRLAVIPEKQGRGLAKQLLQALEEFAYEHGVKIIFCKVRATVPKNLHLYRSVGFETYEESAVTNKNGKPVQVVSMKRLLERRDF